MSISISVSVVPGKITEALAVFGLFQGVETTPSGLSVYGKSYLLVHDTVSGEIVVHQPTAETFVLRLHELIQGNGIRVDEHRSSTRNMIVIPSIFNCAIVISTGRQ